MGADRVGLAAAALFALAGCQTQEAAPSAVQASTQEPVQQSVSAAQCMAGEGTIFACTMPSGDALSVCSNSRRAHYRYGKKAVSIELSGASWASVAYSGGGEAQIIFSKGDDDFIVFSRMVRTNFEPGEPNYPAISDGLIILRAGNFYALEECQGGQAEKPIDFGLAESTLSRRDVLFTDETGRAD